MIRVPMDFNSWYNCSAAAHKPAHGGYPGEVAAPAVSSPPGMRKFECKVYQNCERVTTLYCHALNEASAVRAVRAHGYDYRYTVSINEAN